MDICDQASDYEDAERAAALRQAQQRCAASLGGVSARECRDCGDEIPEARRLALPGVQFCTECASYREARA